MTKVLRCRSCDLLQKTSELFLEASDEKSRYETHNNDLEDPQYLAYLDKLFSRLKPFLSSPCSALDYGCGPTRGLAELVKNSDDHESTDVVSYDPFFYPSLPEGLHDLIFASECFEHFYDPLAELEKMVGLLSDGGILGISTRLSDHENFKTWWYAKDPTHVIFFSKRTFQWISSKFELEILLLNSPHIILRK